ncbi:MAG: GGDEF domain-containing protein [Clostridia bacterium]|nr:GGDEF domain-containing protein [Clostridia bacterium]
MNSIVISSEIVCAVFMLMIILGFTASTGQKNTTAKLFFLLVVTMFVALLTDAASLVIDRDVKNITVAYIVSTASYVLVDFLILAFSFYFVSLIREKQNVTYRLNLPLVLLALFDAYMLITGVKEGLLFTYENGTFAYGPNQYYSVIVPIIMQLYLYALLFIYRNVMGRKYVLVACTYLGLPSIAGIAGAFYEGASCSLIAAAFACGIIYVTVQARAITEAGVRAKILRETSCIDYLTGLKNRRGYDEYIKELSYSYLGVVFCDLNRLKYTNDNFGHAAGDRMIQSFADLLREFFTGCDICRISGDEFVVLVGNISEDEKNEKMTQFGDFIGKNNRMAAFGYAYGPREEVLELVREAEEKMYEDKAEYYSETGYERRH